jgi:hypothetical protein
MKRKPKANVEAYIEEFKRLRKEARAKMKAMREQAKPGKLDQKERSICMGVDSMLRLYGTVIMCAKQAGVNPSLPIAELRKVVRFLKP